MVRFSPGEGLLHVRPGLVLLVAADGPVGHDILGMVDAAADAAPDDPVPGLVRRLAVEIAGEATVPEALAVVAHTGDQVLLWLFGRVAAELGETPERFDASEKITWIEHLVPVAPRPLVLRLLDQETGDATFTVADGTVPAGSVRMDLTDLAVDAPAARRRERPLQARRDGAAADPAEPSPPAAADPEPAVVDRDHDTTLGGRNPVPSEAPAAEPSAPAESPVDPDGTFLPPSRPAPAEAAEPAAPAGRSAPSERVAPPPGSSIVDLRDPDVPVRPPLPRADGDGDTAPPVVPDDAVARVRGVLCPVSHLNDPRARYCSSCGRAMLHTRHEAEGIRPPLGVLVLDDGRTFGLATDYVVGRHPEDDGEVAAGNKRPLALTDAAVSTVHAEFALREWDVEVIDRGSRNGTFVSEDDGESWQSLDADTPRTIRPGAQVSFAGRIVTFETSHRPGG